MTNALNDRRIDSVHGRHCSCHLCASAALLAKVDAANKASRLRLAVIL